MDNKDYTGDERLSLKELCSRVEETTGITPATPLHFEHLASAIMKRTGTLLSPTTLKRLWGYLAEDVSPRRSTLDILANCCGWLDYEDFKSGNTPEIESGTVATPVIRAREEMKPGERLQLMWHPARICVVEYTGDGNWRVVSSEGTRLSAGDRFRCDVIVSGEPLYLDELRHAGSKPGVYVCGRKNGITFLRL